MPGLASTMSWVLQVVDRGASANIARYSRSVAGTVPATARFNAATAAARSGIRGFAVEAAVAGAMAAGIGAAMNRSIRAFGNFEAVTKATQLTLRPTTREMGALLKQARGLPGALEFGPIALSEAQRELGQAGLSAGEVLGTLRPIADVATAGLIKMADAVELGINVTRGFAVPVHETARAMDKLVRAAQLTPLTVGNAGIALSYATGSARAFNQSLDDTVIALGLLIPITKTASKAGTSLRASMQAVFRARGQSLLADIGVAVRDAAGRERSILDIMLDLQKAMKGVDKAQRQALLTQLLGARGLQLYTATVNAATAGSGNLSGTLVRGADALAELRSQVGSTNGETAHFAREMRNTYQKTIERYDAATQSLSVTLGEGFAPVPRRAAEGMVPLVTAMNDFLRSADGVPAKLLAIGSAAAFMMMSMRAAAAGMGAFMTGRLLGAGSALAGPAGAVRSGLLSAAGLQQISQRPGGLLPSLPAFFGPAPITPIAGPRERRPGFARETAARVRAQTFQAVTTKAQRNLIEKTVQAQQVALLAREAAMGRKVAGLDLNKLSPKSLDKLVGKLTAAGVQQEMDRVLALPSAAAAYNRRLVDAYATEARNREAANKGYWSVGRSAGRAARGTWNLAKSAGNLLGGFGMLLLATESVMFAFQRITSTADALYDADRRRLEVAETLLPKLGLLPDFLGQGVAAAKAAGPRGKIRVSQQFMDTLAELSVSGLDVQEVMSVLFKAQQGQITDTVGALQELRRTTAAIAEFGSPEEKALDRVMQSLIRKQGIATPTAGPSTDVPILGGQTDPNSILSLTRLRALRGDQSFWRDLFGMDASSTRTAEQLRAAQLVGAAPRDLKIEINIDGKRQIIDVDWQALIEGHLAARGRSTGQSGAQVVVRLVPGAG